MTLTDDVTEVRGLGPKRAQALSQAHGVSTVEDLIRFYPLRHVDRGGQTTIENAEADQKQSIRARPISSAKKGRGSKRRLVITLKDANGDEMEAVFFHGVDKMKYAIKSAAAGGELIFVGEPSWFGNRLSMTHPDFYEPGENTGAHVGGIVPVYSGGQAMESAGLTKKKMRSVMFEFIGENLSSLDLPTLPESIRSEYDLIGAERARRAIHFPKSEEELEAATRRIEFDEFLSLQLFMQQLYFRRKQGPQLSSKEGGREVAFVEGLPFELTSAQEKALREINEDISRKEGRMKRLIQGDVGSGKTVVAVAAMLRAVDNGHQAAFLAPTTVLAGQHFQTIASYIQELSRPVDLRILTGSLSSDRQEENKKALADGTADIVVGTHALLQGDVSFSSLGLGVIDEQQRFGVRQRQEMFEAHEGTHMLLTSATPIPRSLAMGFYGDLDMTVIDEMPPGRKPVETFWNVNAQREGVYNFLENEVERGHKMFVVYPRVEEDSMSDLRSLEAGFDRLERRFPSAGVGMVHGQMKDEDKSQIMRSFSEGDMQILVATTVIEVGVDVPEATAIMIEDADQLGLSQLHQLRGRVGRSDVQSFCVLMTEGDISEKAQKRMGVMTSTNDGFKIAEADLKIRGAGNMLSTQQSGVPQMQIADPSEGGDAMINARDAASQIVQQDTTLSNHPSLQQLLQRRLSDANRKLARVG